MAKKEQGPREWVFCANPDIYDAVKAFDEHTKIDWRHVQMAKPSPGDDVYIVITGTRLGMKCRVNKTNLDTREIDDIEYYGNGHEPDGKTWMELELIEKYPDIDKYSISTLKENGYIPRENQVTIVPDVKSYLTEISQHKEIDYTWPLRFLKENAGKTYSDPKKIADESEKTKMESLKNMGQAAKVEFDKLGEFLSEKYQLASTDTSWLDGPNAKIRRYLWEELKKAEYEDYPVSISVFAEASGSNETCYRVALELKGNDSEDLQKYLKHLDMEINSQDGLVYAEGSNQQGVPRKLTNETADSIKENINNGTYKKVQLCKYIENVDGADNDYYHEKISDAVKTLLPYYEELMSKEFISADDSPAPAYKWDKNLILYGPPGTGKTYMTTYYAVSICEGISVEDVESKYGDYSSVIAHYNSLKDEKRIEFTTFHQSYGYEEFIEGIKPDVTKDSNEEHSGDIKYKVEPGVFKSFCKSAPQDKPCVFIIDEINRGNISKIFGELITLIEETKREGMPEGAEATLPYSKEKFSVPQNVYILGTMNTADRSIALMDTALRRRFNFVEMMPDSKVISNMGINSILVNGVPENLDVAGMLDTINRRIECLYDREHTIGHAFFTKLKEDPSIETLAAIFKKSIIPLLQEYFYEDYYKIQLVLGDNAKSDDLKFILDESIRYADIFNGSPDIDIPEKKYSINENAFTQIESYRGIMGA